MIDLFQEPHASQLEKARGEARARGRHLTYDCFGGIIKLTDNDKGENIRVYCSRGHLLGMARDGSVALVSVLRGMALGACVQCQDYDDGGETE